MSKTISSYYSSGITLTTADSPVTVTNSGTINAATGDGLLGSDPYAWVVDNAGTIISSQVVGIDLNGTTTVTNEATGTIIGSTYAWSSVGRSAH